MAALTVSGCVMWFFNGLWVAAQLAMADVWTTAHARRRKNGLCNPVCLAWRKRSQDHPLPFPSPSLSPLTSRELALHSWLPYWWTCLVYEWMSTAQVVGRAPDEWRVCGGASCAGLPTSQRLLTDHRPRPSPHTVLHVLYDTVPCTCRCCSAAHVQTNSMWGRRTVGGLGRPDRPGGKARQFQIRQVVSNPFNLFFSFSFLQLLP